jgi:hypothetical protein
MSVSGINQNGGVSAWSQIAPWQQNTPGTASASTGKPKDAFKSDFAALFSAVQSGDMTSAQQALTQLQADQQAVYGPASPSGSASATTATSSTNSSGSPVQNDLQSLISAVKAGDPAAAQKALSTLQGDLKALGGGHHHHHHHGGGSAPAPTTSATDPLATDSTSTDLTGTASANGTASGSAVSS